MPKTTINLRIDEKIKNNAENVLDDLGLSMTSAITIFLKAVARTKSIPFAITSNSPKNKPSDTKASNITFENSDIDLDFDIDDEDALKNAIENL